MDSLKQYLEVQREENVGLKNEIVDKLDKLLHPSNQTLSSLSSNPTRCSNYISELCQFEQKINHKLTEISYELQRFIQQHKRPEYHPLQLKIPASQDDLDDIETLKANSSKLISKLDKLREQHSHEKDVDVAGTSPQVNKTKISVVDNSTYPHCDLHVNFSPNETKTEEFEVIEFSDLGSSALLKISDQTRECDQNPKNESVPIIPSATNSAFIEINAETGSSEKTKENDSTSQILIAPDSKNIETTDLLFQGEISMYSSISESEFQENEEVSIVSNETSSIGVQLDIEKSFECSDNSVNQEIHSTIIDTPESELSQFIWKNVLELNSIKGSQSTLNVKNSCNATHLQEQHEMDDNLCDDSKLTNQQSLLEDTNYENSETEIDSGVLPGSTSSQSQDTEVAFGTNGYSPKMMKSDAAKVQEEAVHAFVQKWLNEDVGDEKTQSANKPIFSAEEKIKKLGLEDRRTLFEKTRKLAILPDLHLKPTEQCVTDAEKLKLKQNGETNKFEIAESEEPGEGMVCVFSHVESPSEFYLHPNTEEAKLIDSLNDLITEQYKKTKSIYKSKREAYRDIGRFCCAYVKDYKMYYRVEVVDWLFEKTDKLVLVQLVDYGNYNLVHYKNLRQLTDQFCLLPKLAIRCYFPLLYPPGSTKGNLLTEWPRSSTEALFELSGLSRENNEAFFTLAHVEKENEINAVELYQINGSDPNPLGQLLLDLGHAVQIILPEDDPMGVLSDEDDIKKLEKCDNINEVILGYDPRDEARICKFTKKDGGRCFKRHCKLEHATFVRDGFTTDQVLTYFEPLNDIKFPKPDDQIAIRFTTFLDGTHFYGNLMYYTEELRRLEVIMNDSSNCSKFEPFKIFPAHGELVIVKHWQKRWLRAKVRHHLFNEDGDFTGAQVYMVDYGDVIDVPMEFIRQIKSEYLILPFQAVECELHNYKENPFCQRKDMDRFFYENMVFRIFSARVVAASDMRMSLEVYHKDRKLGDILTEYGILEKGSSNSVFPHPNSLLIPG